MNKCIVGKDKIYTVQASIRPTQGINAVRQERSLERSIAVYESRDEMETGFAC